MQDRLNKQIIQKNKNKQIILYIFLKTDYSICIIKYLYSYKLQLII